MPNGQMLEGIDGLKRHLKANQDKFIDHFCKKFLAYTLGRRVLPTDTPLLNQMKAALSANEYRFEEALKVVVISEQFRMRRDELRDDALNYQTTQAHLQPKETHENAFIRCHHHLPTHGSEGMGASAHAPFMPSLAHARRTVVEQVMAAIAPETSSPSWEVMASTSNWWAKGSAASITQLGPTLECFAPYKERMAHHRQPEPGRQMARVHGYGFTTF